MRNFLLAAMAAVALLGAGLGGALGQSSGDALNRWTVIRNGSEVSDKSRLRGLSFVATKIFMIPKNEDCCWSKEILTRDFSIREKETLLVNFDADRGKDAFHFDIVVMSQTLNWYVNLDFRLRRRPMITLGNSPSARTPSQAREVKIKYTGGWLLPIIAVIRTIPSNQDCCWSGDLLGKNIIFKDGSIFNFDEGNHCNLDVYVQGTGFRSWYFEKFNVCVKDPTIILRAKSEDKEDRKITVKNDSTLIGYSAETIPSDQKCCWSRNLFSGGVVHPKGDARGDRRVINLDDGSSKCIFDIRVTASSRDTEWNFDRINVCELSGDRTITLK